MAAARSSSRRCRIDLEDDHALVDGAALVDRELGDAAIDLGGDLGVESRFEIPARPDLLGERTRLDDVDGHGGKQLFDERLLLAASDEARRDGGDRDEREGAMEPAAPDS